jgi:hypothetical protein
MEIVYGVRHYGFQAGVFEGICGVHDPCVSRQLFTGRVAIFGVNMTTVTLSRM